jgi:hypothetical protein
MEESIKVKKRRWTREEVDGGEHLVIKDIHPTIESRGLSILK